MIISGFPGTGKSTMAKFSRWVDLESTPFKKNWLLYAEVAKHRLAVYEISDSGDKTLHESLHAAAHAVGGYPTNISRAIKNKKRYRGCYWEYAKGVI